ncbi:hypothetical protein NQ176_g8358 [Zarea fungicola]|uniref:Uncharacterized protein n=1 Tax=Zarea fungicola TaxID=93591 RepID=A0ACC1MV48_9HYPO|nr:hypothetical protein NQ176_g8358 [Lecanicillium fungicola]
MGISLSQLNRVQEAKPWFDSALDFYKLAGDEQTLTSRLGHIYCFQLLPLAVAQKGDEARKLSNRSLALIAKATGVNSPLHLQTKFLVAMVLFTTGNIQEALGLHKEAFKKRRNFQGSSHRLTLASRYCLSVCYQNVGDLESVELLLVLQEQKEENEATEIHDEISPAIQELRQPLAVLSSYTDEDDMKLLDFGMSIFHGRTTGIWSNGISC